MPKDVEVVECRDEHRAEEAVDVDRLVYPAGSLTHGLVQHEAGIWWGVGDHTAWPAHAILGLVLELDDGNGPNPDQDSKPFSSSGAEQHPGSNAGSLPERNDRSGQQRSIRGTGGDGSPPMSMANALSLFAPPADRDVANELDLLDMMDVDEQYEIVKSFASKHIVPYMRG